MSTNSALQGIVGFMFTWKTVILAVTVFLSILIYRPFCKYICPLGAIYALFNKVSVYCYSVDSVKCTGCEKCAQECPMNIDPRREPNHFECVRCGRCKSACPAGAISSGLDFGGRAKDVREKV